MSDYLTWLRRLREFEADAAVILGASEEAVKSRTYNATQALQEVSELTFDQADSLKQAVRCVEHGLYQSAVVMAWVAIADLLLEVAVREIDAVKSVRTNWKFTDKNSLSEERGDYVIAEALKLAGVITKTEMKTLHGLLHRRNQCAHRTDVFPTPNEALGFIDETIAAAKFLSAYS